jgi:hypothetical protein
MLTTKRIGVEHSCALYKALGIWSAGNRRNAMSCRDETTTTVGRSLKRSIYCLSARANLSFFVLPTTLTTY